MVNITLFASILSLIVSAVVVIVLTLQYLSVRQQLHMIDQQARNLHDKVSGSRDIDGPRYEAIITEQAGLNKRLVNQAAHIDTINERMRNLQAKIGNLQRELKSGRKDDDDDGAKPDTDDDPLAGIGIKFKQEELFPRAETQKTGRAFGTPIKPV